MTKISELREQGSEDLVKRVLELDDEVFRLRLQQSMGQDIAAHKKKKKKSKKKKSKKKKSKKKRKTKKKRSRKSRDNV